jgi:protoporphyrinogen oxidase
VFAYLSRFTDWRFYEHRVLAAVDGRLYSLPINRLTLNALYNLDLDESGAAAHFERVRIPIAEIRTSEDVVLNSVGPDLCEKFFRGYTRKQWGLDLSELAAGVAARIPTRTNEDDKYFSDTFQFMPAHTAMPKCSTACSIIQISKRGLQKIFSPFAAKFLLEKLFLQGRSMPISITASAAFPTAVCVSSTRICRTPCVINLLERSTIQMITALRELRNSNI